MPDKKELYEKYVTSHTGHLYGEPTLAGIESQFPAWRAYFGGLIPGEKEARILDIGCGYGDFVHWLKQEGYEKAEGIDLSSEQISRGTKLGIQNIRTADIFEFLPWQKNAYDAIVARDVLEHFHKDEVQKLLAEAYEALGPGGIFIAQTVNAENPLWGRLRHADFTHELAFTKESIAQILRLAGFEKISIYPQRPVVHGPASFIRSVLWRIIEWKLAACLLIETGSAKGIFTQNLIVKATRT